jgi:hypothetical protein
VGPGNPGGRRPPGFPRAARGLRPYLWLIM